MPDIKLNPITKMPKANLDLPGSKSIANRVLPLAAISSGISIIHNVPSDSEDVALMLKALHDLGVSIKEIVASDSSQSDLLAKSDSDVSSSKSYEIHGCAGVFPNKSAEIFCGNSGTTIRFLGAILAVMNGDYILDGVERMHERPIKDLVLALKQIGVEIKYLQHEGYPPFKIHPFVDNQNAKIAISGKVSSQYLTGVLLAATLLKRQITIEVYDELISKPYVDITLNLLAQFGVKTKLSNIMLTDRFTDKAQGVITHNSEYSYIIDTSLLENSLTGIEYTVEPDASSASYFLALGAISGEITVNNLNDNSLQGDRNFAHVLKLMGADVTYNENSIRVTPGSTMQTNRRLIAIDVNMEDMPDVAMTIAVMALFAAGTTTISGIHSWKVKETDRLLAMYNELTKLGAAVVITDSSISITPPLTINPNVAIDTYNDHRMAMCFSLVAAYGVAVIIKDYECVNKTFPSYFKVFCDLCYA